MKTKLNRRDVLHSGIVLGASALLPTWMPRMSFTPQDQGTRGDVLIVVFLRGAADSLNMVIPFGDDAYYQLRPTIAIPQPDSRGISGDGRILDLDGFFGLHPAMRPLLPIWEEGDFVPIVACGAPDDSRSHFKAMELMERGIGDERGPASGWVGRHLAALDSGNTSPLRAIGFGEVAPRSLQGSIPVTALKSITDFHLNGVAADRMRTILTSLYAGPQPLHQIGRETLDILQTIENLPPVETINQGGPGYPETDFGLGLHQIGLLIEAEVGLEVAALDLGGWDTHFAQGGTEGIMARLLDELAVGLAAFYEHVENRIDGITLVVMTEFGRRGRENASLGTDHGHGTAMLLLGGHLVGGRVHGSWPGLSEGQLIGPGDLAVTTDYRDVLAELLVRRCNNTAIDVVFPDFRPSMPGSLYE